MCCMRPEIALKKPKFDKRVFNRIDNKIVKIKPRGLKNEGKNPYLARKIYGNKNKNKKTTNQVVFLLLDGYFRFLVI